MHRNERNESELSGNFALWYSHPVKPFYYFVDKNNLETFTEEIMQNTFYPFESWALIFCLACFEQKKFIFIWEDTRQMSA